MKMMPSDCCLDWDRIEPASHSNIHILNPTGHASSLDQMMDHTTEISQEGTNAVKPQSMTAARGFDSSVACEELLPEEMESAAGLERENVEDSGGPPCMKTHARSRSPDDQEVCAGYSVRSCTVAAPPQGEGRAVRAGPDDLPHGSPDDHSHGSPDDCSHESTVKGLPSGPQSGFHFHHGSAFVGNGQFEITDLKEGPGSPSSFDCVGGAPKFPLKKGFSKEKIGVRYCASPFCGPVSVYTDENQNVAPRSLPKSRVSDHVATADRCLSTHRELEDVPKKVFDINTSAASGHGQVQSDRALEPHLSETVNSLSLEQTQSSPEPSPPSANELYSQAESGLEPQSSGGYDSPPASALQPRTHSSEEDDSLPASECRPGAHSSRDASSHLLEQAQSGFSLKLQPSGHSGSLFAHELDGRAQSDISAGPLSRDDVGSVSLLTALELADVQSGLSLKSQSSDLSTVSLLRAVTLEPGQADLSCEPAHSSSAFSVPTSANVDHIPDELLLKFFAFLSPVELCRHVTAVCKRWHRLAYDSSLWRHLDISTWRMNGPQLRQIVLRVPGAIKYLDMSGLENLNNEEMASVAENCPDMTDLDMGFVDDLNSTMMEAILASCPKLQFINVEGCRLANNEVMRVLAASAGPMLRRLNFSHCPIVDESLSLMMKHIPCITHLNIDGISWISELVVQHLATKYCNTFESLELDGNELSDSTIYFVSFCHRLKTLSISFCERLTDLTVKYLLRLERLEKLVLRKGPSFSAVAMMEFFSTSTVQNLTYLDLTECQQLEDEGVKAISQRCGPSLRTLCLSWCWNITDIGMGGVASSCPRMVKMYLVGLHRLEGLWLPAAMESMPSLSYISFEQCNEVQDTVIEEAVRGKPDLVILNYYGEVFVHKSLH